MKKQNVLVMTKAVTLQDLEDGRKSQRDGALEPSQRGEKVWRNLQAFLTSTVKGTNQSLRAQGYSKEQAEFSGRILA